MFEHVPKAATPPPAAPTAVPAQTTGQPIAPSPVLPEGHSPLAQGVLADQATIEMFKRTGLTSKQKIIIVGVSVLVLSVLIGGGIWMYLALDPSNQTAPNTSGANANSVNVPLQELDTDKDGVRDIDEKRYSTDVNLSDTDADGLSDYLEIFQYKTNPTVSDTDGDTYVDGDEIANGYDPNGLGKLAH